MIHYLPICFILAILGTLLANPMLYYCLSRSRKDYEKDLKNYEENKEKYYRRSSVSKDDYKIIDSSPIALIIGQVILFALTFGAASLLYFYGPIVVSYSTILAYLWIPAIAQCINLLIFAFTDENCETCLNSNYSVNIVAGFALIAGILVLIPSCIGIHKGVYGYLHPYDDITIMAENHEEYPTIDEQTLLKEANLAAGSTIYQAIYRNGEWIYPVVNNTSHATSSGYIVVDASGENIHFEPRDIVYSPWINSTTNSNLAIRRNYPFVVFFGDSTFQVNPETGDIYFCQFYGEYECFRAGRDVQGALLINATTGKIDSYTMKEIPEWVSGISF